MTRADDLYRLPGDLPLPVDDGTCAHLPGMRLPDLHLTSTGGGAISLARVEAEWVVAYCYPRTGTPDEELLGGATLWNSIPGARGCTPQSCAYRDHHGELSALGARVFGISTQPTDYQSEAASRLHLPYALLSDVNLALTGALRLPTFSVESQTLIRRLTLIAHRGVIEHCLYPVFPPTADAENVVRYLQARVAAKSN